MSGVRTPTPIALVGGGKHGQRYLRHIVEELPELRVAILCRRDERAGREQAARAGARYVADFREAASSPDVDAVVAVVPPSLNGDLCEAAAAAGKAILVEKPLATGVAEGLRIRDAVARHDVPLMVAQTLRFDRVVRAIRERLPAIGPLVQIGLSQRFEPSRLDWLDDPAIAGGGIVLHTGVHGFDLLRWLVGKTPRRATAAAAAIATSRTEDNFAATFDFEGGVVATVAGSRSTRGRSGWIEIAGAEGQLCGDHVHGFAYAIDGTSRRDIDVGPPVPTVRESVRAFAAALRTGGPMPITLDDGLAAVAMAEAVYASIASGRAEEIVV
jgi:predicted dehydrogenase